MLNNCRFITLTNDGYVDYTLNCLASLNKLNLADQLNCYCLGEKCYMKLKKNNYNVSLLPYEQREDREFNEFRKGNWHNITKRKFDIIYANLKKYNFVCITDGDIVFLNKDFLKFCYNYIRNYDLLICNDQMEDKSNKNLCSGFMVIKSSDKTISLFDPRISSVDAQDGWGDQIYLNQIKNKIKYKTLPLNLFPNGKFFKKNHSRINPYMIHFNFVIGHNKKKFMQDYNYWFL